MLLGILAMGAVSHQTLSTGERVLPAMAKHAHPVVAWGFALAAMVAAVCAAAPTLPCYYYHIPSMTGVDIPMMDFVQAIEPLAPSTCLGLLTAAAVLFITARVRGST